MCPQDGGRARGSDGAVDCPFHSIHFRGAGYDAVNLFGCHNGRNGHRQGVSRHGIDIGEAAIVDLLLTTDLIKLNNLHRLRIVEIRYRRIVERQMPVLPNAHTGDIQRIGCQQSAVALTFRLRIGSDINQVDVAELDP